MLLCPDIITLTMQHFTQLAASVVVVHVLIALIIRVSVHALAATLCSNLIVCCKIPAVSEMTHSDAQAGENACDTHKCPDQNA